MTDKPVVPATEKLRRIYDALAESIDDTPGEELFEEMTPEDHQKCAELKEWALKTVRKYKPQPSPGIEAEATTRFDDFDDPSHPANKWWEERGQFMISGGGRREFIWACRGWIAREQLACGVEVTGDSLHETRPPAKSTSVEAATTALSPVTDEQLQKAAENIVAHIALMKRTELLGLVNWPVIAEILRSTLNKGATGEANER